MTMITPSYLGETIEYSSLHACRSTLEDPTAEAGRTDEALDEFHAVAAYFPGAEARVRYALLLKMAGRTAEAKVVFAELLIQMKRAPKYLREAQAEWISIAEKQLSA